MPISLADLQADRASIVVETRLGPVAVTYRPNVMTPTKEAELSKARLAALRLAAAATRGADDDDDLDDAIDEMTERMIGHFCDLVEAVDISGPLLDDDGVELVAAGKLIPVEPRYINYLPMRFVNQVIADIQSDSEEDAGEHSKSSKNGARPDKTDSRRGSRSRR